jgi:L-alanine-DL-glutamate epimerase-like enolase superfamily enzyme
VSVTFGSVDAIVLSVPALPTEQGSPWLRRLGTHVVIRVGTSDPDLYGWGESFAIGASEAVAAVIRDAVSPVLSGRRHDDPRDAVEELQRELHQFAGSGIGQYALSGVDIALWDLAGKMQGLSVAALLGEVKRSRIPAMASLLRYEAPTDVARATESWLAAGFASAKLHQRDVGSVRAAIAAAGDPGRVALDLNCAWQRDAARDTVRALDPLGLLWIEEPVWPPDDYDGLARIRASSSTPIAAGENEAGLASFTRLMDARAVDVVQPSVAKAGGISVVKDVIQAAATRRLVPSPHSFYFGPGLAACVHLAAAFDSIPWVEFPAAQLEQPLVSPDIVPVAGHFRLPAGPGLGVEVSPDLLAAGGWEG